MSTQRFFASWCARPEWQRMKPFDQFAAMIDRNLDGIIGYCVSKNKIARSFVRRPNKTIRDVHRDLERATPCTLAVDGETHFSWELLGQRTPARVPRVQP